MRSPAGAAELLAKKDSFTSALLCPWENKGRPKSVRKPTDCQSGVQGLPPQKVTHRSDVLCKEAHVMCAGQGALGIGHPIGKSCQGLLHQSGFVPTLEEGQHKPHGVTFSNVTEVSLSPHSAFQSPFFLSPP